MERPCAWNMLYLEINGNDDEIRVIPDGHSKCHENDVIFPTLFLEVFFPLSLFLSLFYDVIKNFSWPYNMHIFRTSIEKPFNQRLEGESIIKLKCLVQYLSCARIIINYTVAALNNILLYYIIITSKNCFGN